jgi:hypothetical protein
MSRDTSFGAAAPGTSTDEIGGEHVPLYRVAARVHRHDPRAEFLFEVA